MVCIGGEIATMRRGWRLTIDRGDVVWIIDYFVSSHSLKDVAGVKRSGRVECKVACMNGCHLLVAILDCGAEMLSLFRTRQGQIG